LTFINIKNYVETHNNIFCGIISSVPGYSWAGHQVPSNFHNFRSRLVEAAGRKFTIPRSSTPNKNQPSNDQHQCTKCGKVYRWKKSLSLHLRVECGKEPQFQCPICPYKAKQKGNLKSHIRVWHSTSLQVQ